MNHSLNVAAKAISRAGRRRRSIDLASIVQARTEVDDPRVQFTAFDRM